jgi:hypothetical protein
MSYLTSSDSPYRAARQAAMESESGVRGYPVELVFLAAVNMMRPPEKWGESFARDREVVPGESSSKKE